VHGTDVAELRTVDGGGTPRADAAWTRTRGLACGILVADCLPVLLCARDASCVSAAHCGWRGLADGVLAALVAAIPVGADSLLAWIGPGIGASRYEVGSEVVERVRSRWGGDAVGVAFRSSGLRASTHADLEALARFELRALGITDIHGGGFCTARDPRFYSYRRDGVTGRMAALVWRS
jgi:YfiH family protein